MWQNMCKFELANELMMQALVLQGELDLVERMLFCPLPAKMCKGSLHCVVNSFVHSELPCCVSAFPSHVFQEAPLQYYARDDAPLLALVRTKTAASMFGDCLLSLKDMSKVVCVGDAQGSNSRFHPHRQCSRPWIDISRSHQLHSAEQSCHIKAGSI